MKFVVALIAAAILATTISASTLEGDFQAFKAKFDKSYASPEEERRRLRIFAQNMKTAAQMKSLNPEAEFGASKFADLTPEEFHKIVGRGAPKSVSPKLSTFDHAVDPRAGKKVDWRKQGAITAVWNQGQCGDGWAFDVVDSASAQWKIHGKGPLIALSAQMIVSCDTTDYGCDGGLPTNAMEWIIQKNGGRIETNASFPYVSGNGVVPNCTLNPKDEPVVITGHQTVGKGSETIMAGFVEKGGPLIVGVDAVSFQLYQSGVLKSCQSTQVDHAVLLVGFDDSASTPYWIAKNSWGTEWGEQGYIYIQKGVNACDINDMPSTVLV